MRDLRVVEKLSTLCSAKRNWDSNGTTGILGRVSILENGGQGRNRTADASLFRAALYQLSYLAGRKFILPDPVTLKLHCTGAGHGRVRQQFRKYNLRDRLVRLDNRNRFASRAMAA